MLLYETCCIYEIVITNYFLQLCGHELVFATIGGKPVMAQEKFSLNPYILHTADYAEKDGIFFIPVYWAWLL